MTLRVRAPARSTQSVLWRSFTTGFEVTAAERWALVARAWFYAVITVVLASMWRIAIAVGDGAVIDVDGADPTVAGYSSAAIFWYIAAAEAALIPVPSNLIEQASEEITDGSIEAWFARPVTAGLPTVMFRFGQIVPVMVVCAVTGVGLSLILVGPPVRAAALALAVPALLLAVALAVAMQYAVGAMAFRVGDISGLWLVYHRLVFIFGGLIIPLEALPPWLEPVARALPFMATVYVPGRLAAGYVEPMLLARQLLWLMVFLAVVAVAYRRGEERTCRRGL